MPGVEVPTPKAWVTDEEPVVALAATVPLTVTLVPTVVATTEAAIARAMPNTTATTRSDGEIRPRNRFLICIVIKMNG